MPPPRPYWKGYLKLSLVSCPIAVYPATSSGERVAFRQVNKTTGNRLKQQLVDEGTGAVVEAEDKGRGYEIGRGDYLLVDDDELSAIAIESTQTIEIDSFVPRAEIDARYHDAPYYLVPEGKVAQDAFAVIRDAMRGTDQVALGRVVLAKRERVVMLQAWDKGIMATTLRYANEVRDTAAYFDHIADVGVPADMLTLAEHILRSKAGHFDPSVFRDRYEDAVLAMLKAKQAGRPADVATPAPAGAHVVNLMELLRRSIGGPPKLEPEGAAIPQDVLKPKRAAKTPKRVGEQREMLLPIDGKRPSRDQAKVPVVKPVAAKRPSSRKAG